MSVKVSVVVPVYNPGSHIDDGLDSLLHQSLPAAEYEAIFVDDGSTDGTGERLDRVAAEHDNVRVFHIPNSGWPGRPRNIGLDAARGEYVLFMDNDDRLSEEALERLYDRAVADEADIVVGKVVGHGRQISRELFAANRRGVDIGWPPLLDLLTPHKLFRRAFVEEHGLRFPEGRVRLEDHAFVVPAFFAAGSISVLADHPVYHWIKHDDETNASSSRLERAYWESLRGVLDVVEAHTEPGDARERLLSHWLRSKMLMRLGGAGFARRPPDYQQQLFEEIGAVARERMTPAVTRRLRSALRTRARLLEAGRLDGLRALADVEAAMTATVTLRDLDWDDGALRIGLEAALTDPEGRPLAFERAGDRLLRVLPPGLPGAEAIRPEDRDIRADVPGGAVEVFARLRETREDYPLPVDHEVRESEQDDGSVALAFAAVARLDPVTAAAGAALRDGIWDISVKVDTAGLFSATRLALGEVALPPPALTAEDDSRVAIAYETREGNLSLDLGGTKRSLFKLARADATRARTARKLGAIAVSIPLAAVSPPRAGGRAVELVLADADTARAVTLPARLVAEGGGVQLRARIPFRRRRQVTGTVGPGAWLASAAMNGVATPLRLTVGVARDGSARVRHTQQSKPRPGAVPPTALRRALRRVVAARGG